MSACGLVEIREDTIQYIYVLSKADRWPA